MFSLPKGRVKGRSCQYGQLLFVSQCNLKSEGSPRFPLTLEVGFSYELEGVCAQGDKSS